MAYCQGFQFRFVDFDIKMTGIGQDDAIFHVLHMFSTDDIFITRQGNKNIPYFSRFCHRHDFKSVKDGFNRFDGVYFGDYDMSSQAFGSHGTTFAAPAIAGDDDALAHDGQIGRTHDAIPRRLTCTIAVIEEIFAVRIVRRYHGELQRPCFIQSMETVDPGRRFFRATQKVFHGISPCRVQEMDLISAIINDDIGMMVQRLIEEAKIFFIRRTIPGINGQTIFYQSCRYIILCGQRIAARNDDVGSGPVQYFSQIGRLGFQMDADADGLSFKGLVFLQLVANGI